MYTSLAKDNKSSFELLIGSPLDIPFDLPAPHKYFKTDLSVPAVAESLARIACGEYVLHIADDMQFVPGYLDHLSELAKSIDMNKKVIVPHIGKIKRKRWIAKVKGKFHGSNENWPIVGLYALMKRSVWLDSGGLDRRFKAICWNNDMVLRFYQNGGSCVLANPKKGLAVESRPGCVGLTRKFGAQDWGFIEKLWHPKGAFTLKRQLPLAPYLDNELLTI